MLMEHLAPYQDKTTFTPQHKVINQLQTGTGDRKQNEGKTILSNISIAQKIQQV